MAEKKNHRRAGKLNKIPWRDQIFWYRIGVLIFTPALLNVFFHFMSLTASRTFAWVAYLTLVTTLTVDWFRVWKKRREVRSMIRATLTSHRKSS